VLLSAAVESAAAEPFQRVMRKQVFEPLGMVDTRADEAGAPAPDQATSYFPRFAADPAYGYHDMRPIDLSCYAGAASFVSTPSDLVRFGNAIVNGSLLGRGTVDQLLTPQQTRTGAETGYGLGWDLETATLAGRPTLVAGHDGDLQGGMVASLLLERDRRLVVAVTSNISYADTFAVAVRVADAFARQTVSTGPR
jgi:CubicO group peptidase (beta-lactamase class C family)